MRRIVLLAPALAFLGTAAAQPAFEVASVKAVSAFAQTHPARRIVGGPGTSNPGTIEYREMSLKDLVFLSYRAKTYQLTTPSWMADAFVNIQARVPTGATRDDVPLMLQRLLEERFELRMRYGQKEIQGFGLTVSKNGPTIQPSPESPGEVRELFHQGKVDVDKDGFAILPRGASTILAIPGRDGLSRLTAARTNMASFCVYLERLLQQPVVDQTQLTGLYDFHLKYVPDIATPGNTILDTLQSERDGTAALDPAPTIPVAVATQLGLRLQSQKVMTKSFVIDSISRTPTGN